MVEDEFNKIVMVLNTAYPRGGPLIKDKEQATVWFEFLKDLDYKICKQAVSNYVLRNPFPPAVADIRKEYAELANEPMLGEAEAWAMVRDGIKNGTYGATEEFSKFPPEVQRAVGNPMSLSEWAMLSPKEVETVVQSQFLNAYRVETNITKNDRQMGLIGARRGAMAQLAATVAERLVQKDG